MASGHPGKDYHLTNAFPYEIRQQIFREALVYPKPVHLNRLCSEPHVGITRVPLFIVGNTTTALLQTCSQIRQEAKSIFWEENIFHYTMRPDGPASIYDLIADLPKIKHLKIDFSVANFLRNRPDQTSLYDSDQCTYSPGSGDLGLVTAHLARELELIARHTTQLRTLDLHLVSHVCCEQCSFSDYLFCALCYKFWPDAALQHAFSRLKGKVHDRFSLFAFTCTGGYYEYRKMFAPLLLWAEETFPSWPGLNVKSMGDAGLQGGLIARGPCAIRKWTCWPKWSMSKQGDLMEMELGRKAKEEGCWAWEELGLEEALAQRI